MAFCGLNGAIMAGTIAAQMLIYPLALKPIKLQERYWLFNLVFLFPIATVLIVFFDWRPSGASGIPQDVVVFDLARMVIENWILLISPRPWQLPPVPAEIYYATNILLYLGAIAIIANRIWISRNSSSESLVGPLALFSVMLATLLLLLSISIGRSNYWSPGLEKHYGYLAVIFPLASWIIISSESARKLTHVVGVFLLAMYGSIYFVNTTHAFGKQLDHNRRELHQTFTIISSGIPVDKFVEKHIKRFNYIDTKRDQERIVKGIREMKAAGISPYIYLKD